ncbi:hypothetical protein I302_103787 [Kwoniella bestiolae CBS 10118]|uniref:Uncharacterized protein n=1 Tax=Kwoniella bestiolae CBS 10118 TaxID=1296100 RepID=A0A1B9G9G1_9TREE|nr:hypothetical protein I302_02491 [Kwoniella bestiolae CBS 10118]OCF27647.1 hypothetical protein I302_02491 [Kwoniella bestiolae CBS 10118]
MQLSTLVLPLLPLLVSVTAQDQLAWPAPSEGCDLNIAKDLYASHSAKLASGGPSTTVLVGFPIAGAPKPTDQCEDTAQKRVVENGRPAYIAPTGGAYGMSK